MLKPVLHRLDLSPFRTTILYKRSRQLFTDAQKPFSIGSIYHGSRHYYIYKSSMAGATLVI